MPPFASITSIGSLVFDELQDAKAKVTAIEIFFIVSRKLDPFIRYRGTVLIYISKIWARQDLNLRLHRRQRCVMTARPRALKIKPAISPYKGFSWPQYSHISQNSASYPAHAPRTG